MIILAIVIILYILINPNIDYSNNRVIIWYNTFNRRKYFILWEK